MHLGWESSVFPLRISPQCIPEPSASPSMGVIPLQSWFKSLNLLQRWFSDSRVIHLSYDSRVDSAIWIASWITSWITHESPTLTVPNIIAINHLERIFSNACETGLEEQARIWERPTHVSRQMISDCACNELLKGQQLLKKERTNFQAMDPLCTYRFEELSGLSNSISFQTYAVLSQCTIPPTTFLSLPPEESSHWR
jgi:hypothetical protein